MKLRLPCSSILYTLTSNSLSSSLHWKNQCSNYKGVFHSRSVSKRNRKERGGFNFSSKWETDPMKYGHGFEMLVIIKQSRVFHHLNHCRLHHLVPQIEDGFRLSFRAAACFMMDFTLGVSDWTPPPIISASVMCPHHNWSLTDGFRRLYMMCVTGVC